MIRFDEDALICDLAETYQIYDYRQLPLQMVAVFSYGLRDDSRIKMSISKQSVPLDTLLLAGVSDRLAMLLWSKTVDAEKGRNKPDSIFDSLTNVKKESSQLTFSSGEEFEQMRQKILEGGG
jgi:hypothetical protein